MFVNGKMRPIETIPGMGGGEGERWRGWIQSAVIYSKKFCKCHNVPSVQQIKKLQLAFYKVIISVINEKNR
jgi:hypothetical protein